jgi:hypothetical protein
MASFLHSFAVGSPGGVGKPAITRFPALPDGVAQLLPLSPLSWFCEARCM